MKIRLMVAMAILTTPLIGLAQPQLDEDLKGKIDTLCFNPIFGIQDNYNKKRKPVAWNFEQAFAHTRFVMGSGHASLVDPLTPVVLRVINDAIRSVREEKNPKAMTGKLLAISNLCVLDVTTQIKTMTTTK